MFNRSRGVHYADLPKADETVPLRKRADDTATGDDDIGVPTTETDDITAAAVDSDGSPDYIPADD